MSMKSSRYAKIHIIENGTHNESWLQGGTDYWSEIKDFMQHTISMQPHSGGMASSDFTSKQAAEQVQQAPHTVEKIPSSAQEKIGSPSIPLMPKRLVGMLSEVVSGGKKEGETPAKKEN